MPINRLKPMQWKDSFMNVISHKIGLCDLVRFFCLSQENGRSCAYQAIISGKKMTHGPNMHIRRTDKKRGFINSPWSSLVSPAVDVNTSFDQWYLSAPSLIPKTGRPFTESLTFIGHVRHHLLVFPVCCSFGKYKQITASQCVGLHPCITCIMWSWMNSPMCQIGRQFFWEKNEMWKLWRIHELLPTGVQLHPSLLLFLANLKGNDLQYYAQTCHLANDIKLILPLVLEPVHAFPWSCSSVLHSL